MPRQRRYGSKKTTTKEGKTEYQREYMRERQRLFAPLMNEIIRMGREEIKKRGLENASIEEQHEFMREVTVALTRAFKGFCERRDDE